MGTVLVTGGSGFVGAHCILRLLADGHQVRTTIRDLSREGAVRAMLARGGTNADGRLSFFPADLERDDGWKAAADGCDHLLHVASPFPSQIPKDESELIRPAREGALRVLRAARDAGVQRVVLTSSFAAVSYGPTPASGIFTEANWSDVNAPDAHPYMKSKTLAERAAWEFVEREGAGPELSVVNPVGIFGPVLGPDLSTSTMLIKMMLDGALPGAPRIHFGVIDVRDVADLHVRAMTHPDAGGERFIAVAGANMSIIEIARLLRERLGPAARRVPRHQLPDWLVRLVGLFSQSARDAVPQLGIIRNASSAKAMRLLGWSPRPREEAIIATAESLLQLKLLKKL